VGGDEVMHRPAFMARPAMMADDKIYP